MKDPCQICRGACCEEFSLPLIGITAEDDASKWFMLHGREAGAQLRFECKCTKLTDLGRCSIYETRPEICRRFEVGGEACLDVILRRRSLQQQALIRAAILETTKSKEKKC